MATEQLEDKIVTMLKSIYDPEIPVDIYELGLIYEVKIDKENNVAIDMTLTSAACPLTDVIEDQTKAALNGIVTEFKINWVWMPPWGPDKITDEGRQMLRALGFNL